LARRGFFFQICHQDLDLSLNMATMSEFRKFPDQQTDSVKEFLFDFLMRATEQTANRRPKEHFVGEERLEVGCLFESFMAGDGGATL